MTLPRPLLRAIGHAVQDAAGSIADVDDLVDVWGRLDVDLSRRASRMGYEAQHIGCCCQTPDEPDARGRCTRCWGEAGA